MQLRRVLRYSAHLYACCVPRNIRDRFLPPSIPLRSPNKGRPLDNPLLVHVSSLDMLKSILQEGMGVPFAAPNANFSGKPSPLRAEHIFEGNCMPSWMRGRARSAVGGLHEDEILRVLRPGGVPVEERERVLANRPPCTTGISRMKP